MEAEGTQHREIRKTILDPSRRVIERNMHEDVINSLPPTKRRNSVKRGIGGPSK